MSDDGLKRLNRSDDARRRFSSTMGVRLAGAALTTAGLAFIGFGTLWAPATKGISLTSAPTCATDTECIKPSQVPTAVANSTCSSDEIPGNSAPDPSDSWWHFVVPDSQNWVFTGTDFTASFTGGSVETVTFVQPKSGGFKGVVVEADGGATLTNAFVADSGTTEPSEQEGTGPEGDDFVLSSSCGGGGTTSTTATTTTVTAPGSTVTTTASGSTITVSTPTTVTVSSPTTVTDHSTVTHTETSTAPGTTITTTETAPGTTVTETVTASTTQIVTTTETSNGTVTTTVNHSTTVTAPTTVTNTVNQTTTKTVTTGSASSPASSSSSTSSSTSSSRSSTTPTAGVQATTTTPSTGAGSDIAFGTGLVLLVAGGGLIAGATRITRRKKS